MSRSPIKTDPDAKEITTVDARGAETGHGRVLRVLLVSLALALISMAILLATF